MRPKRQPTQRGGLRVKTKRIVLWKRGEIRLIRPDGGQTAIILSQSDLSATEACEIIFGRWGSQENIFKYLLDQYDLDATVEYGEEETEPRHHPSQPGVCAQTKTDCRPDGQEKPAVRQTGGSPAQGDTLGRTTPAGALSQWTTKKEGKKALKLHQEIELLRAELTPLPPRVEARNSGFHRLKTEMKLLTIGIKLSAYHLETKLVDMVAPFYPQPRQRRAQTHRCSVEISWLNPTCSWTESGFKLPDNQPPCRTRAIGKLCQTLNELKPVYPGTNLQIVFESPVH